MGLEGSLPRIAGDNTGNAQENWLTERAAGNTEQNWLKDNRNEEAETDRWPLALSFAFILASSAVLWVLIFATARFVLSAVTHFL